jgi:hypothetical protein
VPTGLRNNHPILPYCLPTPGPGRTIKRQVTDKPCRARPLASQPTAGSTLNWRPSHTAGTLREAGPQPAPRPPRARAPTEGTGESMSASPPRWARSRSSTCDVPHPHPHHSHGHTHTGVTSCHVTALIRGARLQGLCKPSRAAAQLAQRAPGSTASSPAGASATACAHVNSQRSKPKRRGEPARPLFAPPVQNRSSSPPAHTRRRHECRLKHGLRRAGPHWATHQLKMRESQITGDRVVVSTRKDPASPKKALAAKSRLSSRVAAWYTWMGGHDRAPHTWAPPAVTTADITQQHTAPHSHTRTKRLDTFS